jgi:ribosomal protein L2
MSLNSFSQTSTNNQSQTQVTDTTRVKLKPTTARLVIKDIIKGEGCEEELKLTQEKVIKLEYRDSQKDTIISLLESKDKNSQYIITQQGLQMDSFRDMTEGLKNDVRKANNKTFMYKVGTVVGVLTTSYLLIVR